MQADCGHEVHPSGCTTGYGTNKDGKKLCFSCCAEEDKQSMRETGKATLYLAGDARREPDKLRVTNWPDTLSLPVHYSKVGNHNMAGQALRCLVQLRGGGMAWGDVRRQYPTVSLPEEVIMKFSPIQVPHLYGVEATVGDRKVQVVRAYAGDWRVYGSIGDKIIRGAATVRSEIAGHGSEGLHYQSALKLARRILSGEITPEVWT